ncbi:MAG: hypothetical protein QME94_17485 [Anaerolineae bacterium]|nr:hypothetical protein [Anaerolineae bacterium]
MTRRCTICSHGSRIEIEEALLKGEQSFRTIAHRWCVSVDALKRHKKDHLPAAMTVAKAAQQVARADDLLAQAQSLQEKALALLAQAEADGDRKTALQGVREARGCLELLARLLGELNERPQVSILLAPEWVTVRGALLMALQPYPEARAAVAAALRRLEDGQHSG